METAKRQALTLIQNLADDYTLEDIQYHPQQREAAAGYHVAGCAEVRGYLFSTSMG